LAITLYEDLISDTEIEKVGQRVLRAVRCYVADGIDIQVDPVTNRDKHVLWKALNASGLPQYNDGHPDDASCKVTNIRAKGQSNAQVRIWVRYEQPDFGFPLQPNQFFYKDSITLVQEATQRIKGSDGKYRYLRFSWQSESAPDLKIPEDTLTINVMRPMRVLTLTAITKTRPAVEAYQVAAGKVNSQPWVGSYPKGYWLCMGIDSDGTQYDIQNPSNSEYRISVSFISKINEPWMYDGILRNQRDGKYAPVTQAQVDLAYNSPYVNDIVYPGGQQNKGIIRVGPYQLIDFNTMFLGGGGGGGGGAGPSGSFGGGTGKIA
jgi:hypothetical protein